MDLFVSIMIVCKMINGVQIVKNKQSFLKTNIKISPHHSPGQGTAFLAACLSTIRTSALVSHSTALSRLDSNMIQTFKSGWRLVWGTNWAPAFIGHQSKSERPDTRWQLQVVVRAGCGWRGARSGAEWRGGGWSPAHGARRSQQSPGSGHSGAAGTWYSDTSWYN